MQRGLREGGGEGLSGGLCMSFVWIWKLILSLVWRRSQIHLAILMLYLWVSLSLSHLCVFVIISQAYVAVSRPCSLSVFYPDRTATCFKLSWESAGLCWAGGCGFEHRPDEPSGSLNNWEENTAFVMTSVACENIRFSSLFANGDISRRGTSATQRQKFCHS